MKKESNNSLKVLDCTLRDGGYYNKWDFHPDLVQSYLIGMATSGVNYVELGLRQFQTKGFLGASAYTSKSYIDSLNLPEGPTYGVMIDAKTILNRDASQEESIDILFDKSNNEKIDLVRIAAHYHEVEHCLPMILCLKNKGYIVGLNIMQVSLKSNEELSMIGKLVQSWEAIDVLYFADSLGSMHGDDITRVYDSLRESWKGDIGFHAHNNMGQALANASKAISLGCKWIDGTISGMGRGAGNAELEYMMLMPDLKRENVDEKILFNLVYEYFSNLKAECGWGVSLAYYYGAKYQMHPTYVQDLLNRNLDEQIIFDIMFEISLIKNPQSYDKNILDRIVAKSFDKNLKTIGDMVPKIFKDKEVILVAQTDLSIRYKDAIIARKEENDAVIISINEPRAELDLPYDFVAVSHNEKVWDDVKKYQKSRFSYICPENLFDKGQINTTHNYGLEITSGAFSSHSNYVTIPFPLTLPYAISFCYQAESQTINLVGFGGYNNDSAKQKEMNIVLSLISKSGIEVISLTPSSYTIEEKSIYAFN